MYQAITTKYIGPSNVRGSRVKATSAAGSITLQWDDAANADTNHKFAALQLAKKYQWIGRWRGGVIHTGEHVWVCADRADAADFELSAAALVGGAR